MPSIGVQVAARKDRFIDVADHIAFAHAKAADLHNGRGRSGSNARVETVADRCDSIGADANEVALDGDRVRRRAIGDVDCMARVRSTARLIDVGWSNHVAVASSADDDSRGAINFDSASVWNCN